MAGTAHTPMPEVGRLGQQKASGRHPGPEAGEAGEQIVALERWSERLDAFGNVEEHPVRRPLYAGARRTQPPHTWSRLDTIGSLARRRLAPAFGSP
ncbi:hypothetical protein B1H18_12495 [Streptomyces tsukubensis]|uniref:Uncharacterized protein n=1 Tax=Streptomyces tsukubensis TaxID=83656 RepID=A0A1V4AB78_9ACTN|nr:hypothetical protein B1H18_12495 [Streptomyces tsukubensis]